MNNHNLRIGVALTRCYFCGEGGDILLDTRLRAGRSPVEDMHNHVVSMAPCGKCAELMKKGIILITIDDAKSTPGWHKKPADAGERWMPNPWRTGGFFVMTEEAFSRIFEGEAHARALKHRWTFIEHEAAEKIGLFAAAASE